MRRCEEEREYLKKQQAEVEHKLEVVCKTEADAKAEAKHAQLRYEDREHELNERAALLRRQETELVSNMTWENSSSTSTRVPQSQLFGQNCSFSRWSVWLKSGNVHVRYTSLYCMTWGVESGLDLAPTYYTENSHRNQVAITDRQDVQRKYAMQQAMLSAGCD